MARRPIGRGDIVLVPFPFTDLSGAKRRPAVVVGRVESDDLLLAFVSSQSVGVSSPASHALLPTDPEFRVTGLKVASRVRLDKMVTLHRRLVTSRLGNVGPNTSAALSTCLRYVLDL